MNFRSKTDLRQSTLPCFLLFPKNFVNSGTKHLYTLGICDQKIFKSVFFEWSTPIQRFLQSKGIGSSQSADLCQEAFLRLWKNCSTVSFEKAKSFLFTVANNLAIDEFRAHQKNIKLQQIASSQSRQSNQDAQYQMEMDEFRIALEQAINGMTPASKEVFLLHRFNDMTYKEIAAQLTISVKAVEKRMSKALKHLITQNIALKR